MKSLIDYFARQGFFAILTLIYVLLMGTYAAFSIKKEAFPNVSFEAVSINTLFPGASPGEIEKLITNPLEQDLKEIDGIKEMKSTSIENRSYINLIVDPDQATASEVKQDAQEIVERFTELPVDAEKPIVLELESKDQPIIELLLIGGTDKLKKRAFARDLERKLTKLDGVARVDSFGMEELEIHIEAIPAKLSRYQLSLNDLIIAVKNQNVSIPGGMIESNDDTEFIVRTVGEYETTNDIENTVIRANDIANAIRIKDVAKVVRTTSKPSILFKALNDNTIGLTIIKKESADAIDLVDRVKNFTATIEDEIKSEGLIAKYSNDASYYIKRRLNVLINNLSVGLCLVLLVLSLFFPIKIAILTAIGIPFAFLGTLIFFNAVGISINLLTMMGLIIVVGMLVDDAVVVVENSMRYVEKGHSPLQGAIVGTQEIWQPVTAAVTTTIVVFLPLMFMDGIFGKFVSNLPLGVLAGLILSLIECFFILPHHIGFLLKKTKPKEGKKKIYQKVDHFWNTKLVIMYESFLRFSLKNRYYVITVAIALFISTIFVSSKFMKVVLFPPDGVEIFLVKAEAPTGTTLNKTAELIKPVEDKIAKLSSEELDIFTTTIGTHRISVHDPASRIGTNLAQIIVYLTPEPDRDRTAKEIIEALRTEVKKPEGLSKLIFERIQPGPPKGEPISVGINADEYEHILPVVNTVKDFVNKIPGTSDIRDTYVVGKKELQVKLKQEEAAAAGVSVADVGLIVRSAFEGAQATQIHTLDEEIAVKVTWPNDANQSSLDSISKLRITNRFGQLIPLNSVAQFSHTQSVASLEHQDNERQVRILGDIDTKINSVLGVNKEIMSFIKENSDEFKDVTFSFGGEDKDTKESFASLGRTFIVAILGIFLILVITFQSILQSLLILFLTIPLGVIAVVWAFFVHGLPITFLGSLGLIALSGVIVNNSIVLTVFVNNARLKGVGKLDSIIAACKVRLRPIFLTTITTAFGILPTAYGIGGLDKFVVPMAMALGWGICVGSILTTIVLPSSLAILDDATNLLERN